MHSTQIRCKRKEYRRIVNEANYPIEMVWKYHQGIFFHSNCFDLAKFRCFHGDCEFCWSSSKTVITMYFSELSSDLVLCHRRALSWGVILWRSQPAKIGGASLPFPQAWLAISILPLALPLPFIRFCKELCLLPLLIQILLLLLQAHHQSSYNYMFLRHAEYLSSLLSYL